MTSPAFTAISRPILPGLALRLALVLAGLLAAHRCGAEPPWSGFGRDPQHTGVSGIASQPLDRVVWQTPVDLNPLFIGGSLEVHYGSPLATAANTLVIPVKVGLTNGFRIEARDGGSGALRWQFDSDYTLWAHNWVPSFGPALTPSGRLVVPAGGGTLLTVDTVDSADSPTPTRVAFYGIASYNANPAAFNADIRICTPLVSDALGNVYFGFRATGANPLAIHAGVARVSPNGVGIYVTASAATAGAAPQVLGNSAPALSADGATVYVAMTVATGDSKGYLVALRSSDLGTIAKVQLKDPKSRKTAILDDDASAAPMVGPDGKVYFGVVENPYPSNHGRGWLLQFGPTLVASGAPGAFGWDDTPSLVPAGIVPSYHGASTYLLMVKYNHYPNSGGDGVNKLAILDPQATQTDPVTGTTVMKEVLTIAGVTPDDEYIATYPNAVREWCINSAVVDPFAGCVLVGSEDGKLYRWDLATNTFTGVVTLTPGIGEAYTPTMIGTDGMVYAINNATLFAVGAAPVAVAEAGAPAGLALAVARPNPFAAETRLRFALAEAGRVRLEILDPAGRRVARLVDADLAAGDHTARWDGRDASGRRSAPGVYFARLTLGARAMTRSLVFTR